MQDLQFVFPDSRPLYRITWIRNLVQDPWPETFQGRDELTIPLGTFRYRPPSESLKLDGFDVPLTRRSCLEVLHQSIGCMNNAFHSDNDFPFGGPCSSHAITRISHAIHVRNYVREDGDPDVYGRSIPILPLISTYMRSSSLRPPTSKIYDRFL